MFTIFGLFWFVLASIFFAKGKPDLALFAAITATLLYINQSLHNIYRRMK